MVREASFTLSYLCPMAFHFLLTLSKTKEQLSPFPFQALLGCKQAS